MEFYSTQQQVDAGNASNSPIVTTTNNSNHNTINLSINNNDSNNVSSTSSSRNNSPTSTNNRIADPITVAIAKDMLQLHQTAGMNSSGSELITSTTNNNGNSSSNSSNNSALDTNSMYQQQEAGAEAIAAASVTAAAVAATTTNNNHNSSSNNINNNNSNPPAHAAIATAVPAGPPPDALGYLKYDQELLYINEECTIIGRNSSTSNVHFHVAENNLVSRKHFQVVYDPLQQSFYVKCLSKNGIFVDDFLQRRNAEPLKLPESCYFRFPSTEIRIDFGSFLRGASGTNALAEPAVAHNLNNNHHAHTNSGGIGSSSSGISVGAHTSSNASSSAQFMISPAPDNEHHHHAHHHHQHHHAPMHHMHAHNQQHHHAGTSSGVENAIYSPLKISIPKKEQKSPYLSPTEIDVVTFKPPMHYPYNGPAERMTNTYPPNTNSNSIGMGTISAANSCPASPRQGFHQNQANYNNYGNNNMQSQQDLFQTPSTASYNHNEKPPYSYAQLIVQAISAAPDKQLTLSGIYSFIVKHYPYYRKETNKGWQNSIRHNLSLNRYFIKVARSQDEPGKGSFWRIDPDSGAKLIDHSYKKRRQRSSQGFRPTYNMPRSAPVSPSHMDNSRESSPLQEIVLQSAPGSPGLSAENRAVEAELMYNSQNMHANMPNNSHNQYGGGSPYFAASQNSSVVQHGVVGGQHVVDGGSSGGGGGSGSGGGGVSALIALKRNHAMVAATIGQHHSHHHHLQHQQQAASHHHQQQTLHPDIIYEEVATDFSGTMESGDDECDSVAVASGSDASASKRAKYMSETL